MAAAAAVPAETFRNCRRDKDITCLPVYESSLHDYFSRGGSCPACPPTLSPESLGVAVPFSKGFSNPLCPPILSAGELGTTLPFSRCSFTPDCPPTRLPLPSLDASVVHPPSNAAINRSPHTENR